MTSAPLLRLEAPQELRRVQGGPLQDSLLTLSSGERGLRGAYIVVEFPFVHLQTKRVGFIYRLL